MMNRPKPLVLVADDHPNTTILLQYVFEREGFQVAKATDGAEALRAARELLPDLILLDVMMPLINGFEVLRSLRDDPMTAKIPTVIITANAKEPSDIAKGLNLGADDFLIKPIQPTELVARVMSKMKARQLEDALEKRGKELEALVYVSQKLNEHLAVEELLDLMIQLLSDLLPFDAAAIHYLDQEGRTVEYRLSAETDQSEAARLIDPRLVQTALQADDLVFRLDHGILGATYVDGMGAVLRQGDTLVGALFLLHKHTAYDASQLRVFTGITRQAALALNNARLFAVQAEYALHLEDMVNERTQALQSAQRMIVRNEKLASVGFLAASIAHEIGNSMQPIKTLFSDFRDELRESGAKYDVRGSEIINENIDRICTTIDLMRDFASDRPNAADLLPLDISVVIDGVLQLNQKLLQHSKIKVKATLPPLPLVYGSKSQLQSVFMNLVLNAVAAMEPDGGTLRVKAAARGDMIEIEVADTGVGISPENIDRIFDPFFTTKKDGTGLGLSVSYGIINSHQGTIEVESELGKGASFLIHLPIHHDV
jgi:signal transduction histidine kinase/ActR/RegA family two-component response regulator